MKYENAKQCQSIVETIQKHEKILNALQEPITVMINANEKIGIVYSIGVWSDCKHEYYEPAKLLIDTIKKDLQNRIDKLKSQLELL